MNRSAFLLFLMLISVFAAAQPAGKFVIKGIVTDEKKVPVSNVSVVDTSSKANAVTLSNGTFSITLEKQNTLLKFSHLGYSDTEKRIFPLGDTVYLHIILYDELALLPSIEVSSEKIQLAYEKPNASIFDYAFYESGILLLLEESRKCKLRLVNDYDKTISEMNIHKNPDGLFRDCLDNLHLMYADSVYSIHFTENKLSLAKAVSRPDFLAVFSACAVYADGNYFLKQYGPHNQSVLYQMVDGNSMKRKTIRQVCDPESAAFAEAYFAKLMAMSGAAAHVMGDNDYKAQEFARLVESKGYFYENVISDAVYSPLLELNDSVFVFDHVNDSAFVYDKNGFASRKFPIRYHKRSREWKNELIVDNTKTRVYAKLVKDGITYLHRINPANGNLMSISRLEKHTYLHSINIKDGFAYYIYQQKEDGFSYLYRQRMAD